jgi:LacI family transcriptional regulator
MTKKEQRNATINDLADRSGVSVMTISRYFNQPDKVSDRTKKKIELAIDRLNYHPNELARSLITKKTYTVGVVVPDIRNPFFNTMYHEIDQFMKGNRYNLLLCNTQENEEEEKRALNTLLSRAVDGIILAPVTSASVKLLQRRKTPFVLVDREFEDIETDYIGCDHYSGMCTATEYLIGLGHRNIALISGPTGLYPYAMRVKGYKDTLRKHGIGFNPAFLHHVAITGIHEASVATAKLLEPGKRPSAIIASNNHTGSGVLKALFDGGLKVPGEMSVVVFDRINGYENIRPKITCIVQPIEFIGRNAASFLLERLKNPYMATQRAVILPELLTGNSCRQMAELI